SEIDGGGLLARPKLLAHTRRLAVTAIELRDDADHLDLIVGGVAQLDLPEPPLAAAYFDRDAIVPLVEALTRDLVEAAAWRRAGRRPRAHVLAEHADGWLVELDAAAADRDAELRLIVH